MTESEAKQPAGVPNAHEPLEGETTPIPTPTPTTTPTPTGDGFTVLGVKFAPLSIPMERRLQTLATAVSLTAYLWFIALTFVCVIYPPLWVAFIPYVLWVYMVDYETPAKGGRRSKWFRNSKFFQLMRDYFPITFEKTSDYELDPSKNYIFGYHPHGIIGLGAVISFGTDVGGYPELFPKFTPYLCTLAENFKYPFFRDYLMAMGLIPVSKESINHVLSSGAGKTLTIVIGGAAEALDARPGTADLTLARRKGFVKIALQNGASLVPTFGFGENERFTFYADNRVGTPLRAFQDKMTKIIGMSFPPFNGRGFFQYSYGLIPHRGAIHVVAGKPIDLPKIENPTAEQLDKYHSMYVEGLRELYDAHKDRYLPERRSSLRIIQ